MLPAQPAPRQPSTVDDALDEVIEKIDATLPVIHKMCRTRKKQKKTPTDRLKADARRRLKELSEDPILTENGSDIREESPTQVNGYQSED